MLSYYFAANACIRLRWVEPTGQRRVSSPLTLLEYGLESPRPGILFKSSSALTIGLNLDEHLKQEASSIINSVAPCTAQSSCFDDSG